LNISGLPATDEWRDRYLGEYRRLGMAGKIAGNDFDGDITIRREGLDRKELSYAG
jgi:hypothetical protein